jgi:hypothetical protein
MLNMAVGNEFHGSTYCLNCNEYFASKSPLAEVDSSNWVSPLPKYHGLDPRSF